MVQYKCIDCGKLSSDRKKYRFVTTPDNYRCRICAIKFLAKNRVSSKKATYKCIVCQKERTDYISNFSQTKENYKCKSCSLKDKDIIEKIKATLNIMWSDPLIRSEQSNKLKKFYIDHPEVKITMSETSKKRCEDPDVKRKMSESHLTESYRQKIDYLLETTDYGEKLSKASKERWENPTYKENMINKITERWKDENHRKKVSDSQEKYLKEHPELRILRSAMTTKMWADPEFKQQRIEGAREMGQNPLFKNKMKENRRKQRENVVMVENELIGKSGCGFWYGHPIINKEKDYCEIWGPELWRRIDAAYEYKSIISGKTKFENNNRHLSRHHVYWQKKACCIWDEDAEGYYAWILNNGKKFKYYIRGDPNKFVLLTTEEHGMVKGNKTDGKDRIYWIKHLENLIDQREIEGKKCYLSKVEYEKYEMENKDLIKKFTKKN